MLIIVLIIMMVPAMIIIMSAKGNAFVLVVSWNSYGLFLYHNENAMDTEQFCKLRY